MNLQNARCNNKDKGAPSIYQTTLIIRSNMQHRLNCNNQQDRQCTYDVILIRVCATIVVVEKLCVTQPVCVFVALLIQRAMRMRHIVICKLPDCTMFFQIIS